MGAHAAGELASQLATDNIPHAYLKRRDLPPCESIVAAVEDANGRIHAKGQNSVDFHGMGTTCSCLLLLPDGALAAHVGDSRVYRLRGHDDRAAHVRPQPGVGDGRRRPRVRGGRAGLRAEERHHALARPASDGEGRPRRPAADAARRPIPAVQRRAHRPAQSAADRHGAGLAAAGGGGADAGRSGQPAAAGPTTSRSIVAEVGRPPRALGKAIATTGPRRASTRLRRATGRPIDVVLSSAPPARGGRGAQDWLSPRARSLPRSWRRPSAARPWASGGRARSAAATMPAARCAAPYGKAPYRRYAVAPTAENIEMLSDIVRQLEDLEAQRKWPFDWREIHEDRGRPTRPSPPATTPRPWWPIPAPSGG